MVAVATLGLTFDSFSARYLIIFSAFFFFIVMED